MKTDDNCKECKKDWTKCGKCPVNMEWLKNHKCTANVPYTEPAPISSKRVVDFEKGVIRYASAKM